MKTHTTKPSEITREWWLVDAEGVVLGRLASAVAQRLSGKHKPNYSPHLDTGDYVVVVNASKIVVTGNKLMDKQIYRHSGYPGGLRSIDYSKAMEERPEEVLRKAVKGMLPSTKLGRSMLRKLKVHAGPEHSQAAQNPKTLDLTEVAAPHNPEQAHTIEEVTGG